MPWKKGESGNAAGKPKGVKNKVSEELRETIAAILKRNLSVKKFQKDLERLAPKDRIKLLSDLLPFIVPRLQSATLEMTNYESLTDEQLDYVIEGLKKSAYEKFENHEQGTEGQGTED